jgi:predicted O-methyltransferase YrrM
MEERQDLSGPLLASLLEAGDFDTVKALLRSDLTGSARALQDEVIQALFESPPLEAAFASVAEALRGLEPDADGFSALAERLAANGAALAALAAQRAAAALDFEAQPAMDVWGGAFNGQARRQTLFDQLLKQLEIVVVIETGTFRGTSTAYMAKAGLPVFSCELNPRYFHYSSLRLANIPNVRLERVDSRRFLRRLFDDNLLPSGPAFFYLDAHWEQDLPLWEEIEQIFSRHPAPVIVVDDFRVPTDSGFTYDDYGKGRCLSVSNLREAVTARPLLFFPNYASADETGERRGCIVLAQGVIADLIMREVPMLAEISWFDALILDGVSELRDRLANFTLGAKLDVSNIVCSLSDELKQTRANNEARLADIQQQRELEAEKAKHDAARLVFQVQELTSAVSRAEFIQKQRELDVETAKHDAAGLVFQVHELTTAVFRAEFIQKQRELEAENAKRDAAEARTAASGLQTLVLRLHEELHSAQTATLELRRAEEDVLRLHEELRSAQTATLELRRAEEDVLRLQEELRSARTATLELRRAEEEGARQVNALQQAFRLAEERAEFAAKQVAELQHSRWRRIGRRLRLARKATFER